MKFCMQIMLIKRRRLQGCKIRRKYVNRVETCDKRPSGRQDIKAVSLKNGSVALHKPSKNTIVFLFYEKYLKVGLIKKIYV